MPQKYLLKKISSFGPTPSDVNWFTFQKGFDEFVYKSRYQLNTLISSQVHLEVNYTHIVLQMMQGHKNRTRIRKSNFYHYQQNELIIILQYIVVKEPIIRAEKCLSKTKLNKT